MKNIFLSGDWNTICDVCGFKYKASELKKRWDGLMVCEKDWETRQPQDLLRVPAETPPPPFVRPEADDVFSSYICSVTECNNMADIGSADCARIGWPVNAQG